jgi:hypothetical protein
MIARPREIDARIAQRLALTGEDGIFGVREWHYRLANRAYLGIVP